MNPSISITACGSIFLPLALFVLLFRRTWLVTLLCVAAVLQGPAAITVSFGSASHGVTPFLVIAAVLAWLPDSRVATIRRLQLLAERSDALVFVFRPCACATQSSPAPLRLMLDKGVPSSGHFRPIGPPVPSALTGTTPALLHAV